MTPPVEHPPTQPTVEEVVARITEYLSVGGLFNPELMEHNKVRDLIMDARKVLLTLSALEKDAARYRWLREQQSWSHSLPGAYPDEAEIIWDRYYSFSGEAVDTAIDLARGATGENNGR